MSILICIPMSNQNSHSPGHSARSPDGPATASIHEGCGSVEIRQAHYLASAAAGADVFCRTSALSSTLRAKLLENLAGVGVFGRGLFKMFDAFAALCRFIRQDSAEYQVRLEITGIQPQRRASRCLGLLEPAQPGLCGREIAQHNRI